MKHLLPLLLLFACGPGAGTGKVYRQSAMPMAPAFSPMEDAPITTGQPGYVGEPERLPRGTDRRVLPQTPETRRQAGVWASGNQPTHDSRVAILGVMLPLGADEHEDIAPPLACLLPITDALDNAGKKDEASALPPAAKECLVAMLYHRCLQLMMVQEQREQQTGSGYDAIKAGATARALRVSDAFWRNKCGGQWHATGLYPVLERFLTKAMP